MKPLTNKAARMRAPVIGIKKRPHVNIHGSQMTALDVRRAKAALSSGCKPHPANAPAGSNRSSHGGNEMAEVFE